MKTMSVLEIDQHWPEAEKALKTVGEILVTRDGETIGRLLPVEEVAAPPRKRFDVEEHRRWMKETWGDETFDTLTPLMEDREDRNLISESALAALAAMHDEGDLAPGKSQADLSR